MKRMIKISRRLAGTAWFVLCLAAALCACKKEITKEVSFFAMDTYMNIRAAGADPQAALEKAEERVEELESRLSVTKEGSDLYLLNHADGTAVTVSDDTAKLTLFALEMAEKTSGAYDPAIYPIVQEWGFTTGNYRVPEDAEIEKLLPYTDWKKVQLQGNNISLEPGMELDFGGIAKGLAGDEIVRILKEGGVTSAMINLGGSIYTIGTKTDGSLWTVGIRDPEGEEAMAVVSVKDRAVVTSGGYERYFTGTDGKRYCHIMDPETGRPADSGLSSVTIIGTQAAECDALSTALFIMGKDKAIAYWKEHPGFDMILVTDEKEVYVTKSIREQFSLCTGNESCIVNVVE